MKPIEERIFAHLRNPKAIFTAATITLLQEASTAITSLRKSLEQAVRDRNTKKRVDCRFDCRASRRSDFIAGMRERDRSSSHGAGVHRLVDEAFNEYIEEAEKKKRHGAHYNPDRRLG